MALDVQLTAFTRKHFLPTVVDQIYGSNPIFVRMRSRAMPLDGGLNIEQFVTYAIPTAGGTYSGYDVLNVTPSEQFTQATFNWAHYYEPIPFAGTDDRKNSGKNAIVNLLKATIMNAEKAMKDRMGTHLLSNGSVSNSIVGLLAAVDDGTNTASYGGINRSTYTWWQAQYAANGGTGRALTKYLMQNMFGQCTIDNDRPTLLLTSQGVFDKYYLMVDPKQLIMDEKLAASGFLNLLFNGRPIVVDSHITTPNSNHQIYFLNENYLHLYYHKDCNFMLRPFQRPVNQDVIVAYILWMGQFICSSPRMQGRVIDIDPAL